MRINGIRCDGCGKEHLFEPNTMIVDRLQQYLPPDWFIVFLGQVERFEPWLFCSKECLLHHPLSRNEED